MGVFTLSACQCIWRAHRWAEAAGVAQLGGAAGATAADRRVLAGAGDSGAAAGDGLALGEDEHVLPALELHLRDCAVVLVARRAARPIVLDALPGGRRGNDGDVRQAGDVLEAVVEGDSEGLRRLAALLIGAPRRVCQPSAVRRCQQGAARAGAAPCLWVWSRVPALLQQM